MSKVSRLSFAYVTSMNRLRNDLYDYLAQDVVNQCNHMPSMHTTPRTPHEIVTGSKFNFLTDLFMSSVVTSPSIKTPPTLKVYA